MLEELLLEHMNHPDVGAQIKELRKHVLDHEADKPFYVNMIRHLAKDHPILKPNYCPPSRPKKEKVSQFLNDKALECYQNALQDMPILKQGNKSKIKRGGIVGSLEKQRVAKSSVKVMQEELKKRDA